MPLWLLWAPLMLGLPAMLAYSALRTFRALDDQKAVLLRNRVAAVAGRLETLPPDLTPGQLLENLADEPGLVEVSVFEPPGTPGDALAPLWEGRELFRTERTLVRGEAVFRAYIPFHRQGGLRLARIDMAENSADFLVEHARHHLWFVAFSGLVIIALSLFTAWSVRKASEAERKQMALEHLAHIGEMSAVLAHEIRNPLGTIKGFAQLLEERRPADAALLAPILSETSRLEDLVRGLLLYGRPAEPSFQPAAARDLAETLRRHAQQSVGSQHLRFEIDADDVTFETDVNLLEQALLNLIRNAVEAVSGRPDGVVRLEAKRSGAAMLWRVTDNGPGLSAEARRRLFEPFYTTKSSGTGLGLAITRKLVEALGGDLLMSNRDQGGVAAEIRLPPKVPAVKWITPRWITHGADSRR